MFPKRLVPFLILAVLLLTRPVQAMDVPAETYTLPNGLTVTFHEDHSLPQVVINTWFVVGSKDEAPGRTGFAHLFEHLMFMGTERVPGNQFDMMMEGGGGANNASTSVDRTNYYSWGPSSLLPTLLWLDADRMEALGENMTQEKLDLQRSVVRNERRQSYENAPYGVAELTIPEALYPDGHPYHHSVIGSHEDLEAATLQDVKDFFSTYYVPANASLVVAGDFDSGAVKKVIAETFGAVPVRPLPVHGRAEPVTLDHEIRRLAVDKVQYPRLYLVWHSPVKFQEGDAEMDLIAEILAGDSSSRLTRRLVLTDRLAQDVTAYQYSKELGSEFRIIVTASEGSDLDRIKAAVLEELDALKREGAAEIDLKKAKASTEVSFFKAAEDLKRRADMLNQFRRYYGVADSFDRELTRRLAPTRESLQLWAGKVFGEGRLDVRILPEDAGIEGANLDERPEDFGAKKSQPPIPETLVLANGVPLYVIPRPGTGLFSGTLISEGGECRIPKERAGLSELAARMMTSGAGSRDAAAFAEALASLGATLQPSASWNQLGVNVTGLSSKLDETLALFGDAVLRPTLTQEDFAREKDLLLSEIRSRVERPQTVAFTAARALLFTREDPRGRPPSGYTETVKGIDLNEVRQALPGLLNPAGSKILFVGDVDPNALKGALDRLLADWKPVDGASYERPEAIASPAEKRIVLVDRPGAPQTVLLMARPAPVPGEPARTVRDCVNTLFGASFTSRLNQNLREKNGYTYGARSSIFQQGDQGYLYAFSSVQTPVTGAALGEFRKEFLALAGGDITAGEQEKAVKSYAYDLMTTPETTSSLAGAYAEILSAGRPLDALRQSLAALDSVEQEDLNAEARSGLFDWDSLLVVIVGDKEQILPQLKEHGFEEPLLADEEGKLL